MMNLDMVHKQIEEISFTIDSDDEYLYNLITEGIVNLVAKEKGKTVRYIQEMYDINITPTRTGLGEGGITKYNIKLEKQEISNEICEV